MKLPSSLGIYLVYILAVAIKPNTVTVNTEVGIPRLLNLGNVQLQRIMMDVL